jgi:hypothetical protein
MIQHLVGRSEALEGENQPNLNGIGDKDEKQKYHNRNRHNRACDEASGNIHHHSTLTRPSM